MGVGGERQCGGPAEQGGPQVEVVTLQLAPLEQTPSSVIWELLVYLHVQ